MHASVHARGPARLPGNVASWAVRPLIAHGNPTGLPVQRLEASLRLEAGAPGEGMRLTAQFRVTGDTARIAIPPRAAGHRVDGLWRHTCFEFFVRGRAARAYAEVNLAPSRDWAAYAFAGYREGQRPIEGIDAPAIDVAVTPHNIDLVATLPLAALLPADCATIHAALAAVIEERDGRLTYWALAHPDPQRADFHHTEGFVHEIRH